MAKMAKKEKLIDEGLQEKFDEFKKLVHTMGVDKEEAMASMIEVTHSKLADSGKNMDWLSSLMPSAEMLPLNWQVLRANWEVGVVEYGRMNDDGNFDLAVIASCSLLNDGFRWMHIGVSHPFRYPTFEELCIVRTVMGEESPMVYATIPSGAQVITERDLPLKVVNLYANMGSGEEESEDEGLEA